GYVGPLRDGQKIIIIGGGPGGVGTALTLMKMAEALSREIEVTIYEPKKFGTHYNQCIGVLSPPILEILKRDYDITLPEWMIQREIKGYVLHSENDEILLKGGGTSHALRRVEFDGLLLKIARMRGVEVVRSRVTDIEFHPEDAIVYSESGSDSGDVLVGAFGLDKTMCDIFERRTSFRAPRYLETVVTKFHPDESTMDFYDGNIHVFLPPLREVEFGAIVPKGKHITIINAGKNVNVKSFKVFLSLPMVEKLLSFSYEFKVCYKGCFPITPGKNIYGDRYVIVGDAAGLVRPFKGKGITSGFLTGRYAAETMFQDGITGKAFKNFYDKCYEITGDLWYARAVRILANFNSNYLSLDPLIRLAKKNPLLYEALFDSVSGHDTYKNIVKRTLNLNLISNLILTYLKYFLGF
ncbi:MAG: NAD(P)/FAD-dependent oxidoreductase, partial [Candidatus Methanofastidiosia archaeon]